LESEHVGELDDWKDKYLVYVDRVTALIPYRRMGVWKEFFFKPAETVSKNIDSITQRLIDLYFVMAVSLILGIASALPSIALMLVFNPLGSILGGGIILLIVAAGLLLMPVLGLLYSALEFVVAKILGGKASFTAHFNASILPGLATFVIMLPLTIAIIPVRWLSAIPLVSCCTLVLLLPVYLFMMVIYLYGLYLKYVAFKEVHKFDSLRAIATIFIPMMLLVALLVVLWLLFYLALITVLLGSMSAVGSGASVPA
jgi:hypothetical protein